jgi:hypothetical protein
MPHSGVSACVSPSISVIDAPPRTARNYGLSHLELEWLSAAVHYLRRWPSVRVDLEAHGEPELVVRTLSRKLKSDLALYQKRAGFRRVLWFEVWEGKPNVHAHIVAAMPSADAVGRLIERLYASSIYGPNICAQPIHDWRGTFTYLAKEATPQAWGKANKSFHRVLKANRGKPVSGDRVKTSGALEAAIVKGGKVQPRTRTYAKLPPPPKPEAPIQPIQLALPIAAPPAPFLHLVEVTRKELGLSQREVAQRLGIRQPQYSNSIVRGHDKLGPWAMNRAREFVAHRLAA